MEKYKIRCQDCEFVCRAQKTMNEHNATVHLDDSNLTFDCNIVMFICFKSSVVVKKASLVLLTVFLKAVNASSKFSDCKDIIPSFNSDSAHL